MSYDNNNSYTVTGNIKAIDKDFHIPQSKMNKLIMDYLVTGTSSVNIVLKRSFTRVLDAIIHCQRLKWLLTVVLRKNGDTLRIKRCKT